MAEFTERQVTIAAKLYRTREVLRRLLGDEVFHARVAEVRPLIEEYSRQHHVSELEAATALCKPLVDGFLQLLILAAAVEMVEPSV